MSTQLIIILSVAYFILAPFYTFFTEKIVDDDSGSATTAIYATTFVWPIVVVLFIVLFIWVGGVVFLEYIEDKFKKKKGIPTKEKRIKSKADPTWTRFM